MNKNIFSILCSIFLLISTYGKCFFSEPGLTEAKQWTEALWSNRIESLLNLSETDMTRLFSTAPTYNFLLDPGMSVLDLVMKVKPSFRDSK